MEYGCIGEHLPHSFSREIHELIGSYKYELKEIPREGLDDFMTSRDFRAINVTIPYKELVIPHLYYISDAARAIGAVNTIVNRDGKLYGYNTDYMGINMLAERLGLSFENKKVLILGTGGTSKTAYSVVTDAGARFATKVSRTGKDGAITYAEAYAHHSDADIIINTTPCGMFPETGTCPIELDRFPHLSGVLDAIYNPLRTNLILDAEQRGILASGGLYMLVAQAVAASEIFLDTKYEKGLVDSIFSAIRKQKCNAVLIGMPSCGKTKVGTALASLTGREMIDTDEEFSRQLGISPADYIRANGQDAFRDKESEVIQSIALRGGLVISVGGGAVLRERNVRELKKNGILFWLDRSPELLIPTPDRPLSDTPEKLRALYEERYPIYAAAADEVIRTDEEAPIRAQMIEEILSK